MAAAPQFGSKLIQGHSKRRPVQPALSILPVCRGIPIPFQKHLYRKLFGPCMIPDNPGNHACDALVMGSEGYFQIAVAVIGVHCNDGFTSCIHI